MCRDCPGCATAITVTTDRRLYNLQLIFLGMSFKSLQGLSTVQKYEAEISYSNMVQKRVNKVRKVNGWGVLAVAT